MRRLLTIFILCAAGLLGAVILLPWWFGGLLHRYGASHGLTFAHYERNGYARFVLRDVVFQRPSLKISAEKFEADTPLLWAWRIWQRKQTEVMIGPWRVEVADNSSAIKKTESSERGLVPLQRQLDDIAGQLDRWLPSAKIGAGEVIWPQGKLSLASAVWKDRALQIEHLNYGDDFAEAKLQAPVGNNGWAIELNLPARDLAVQAMLKKGRLEGVVKWSGQPAIFEANFLDAGWKPVEGVLRFPQWKLSGERLRAGQYFSEVSGEAEVVWGDEHLKITAKAAGLPVKGEEHSLLDIALQAEGDAESVTISALHLSFPGAIADLTKPVVIGRDGRLRSPNSIFSFKADLARQPWFKAEGTVTGEAQLTADADHALQAAFTLAADKVVVAGERMEKLRATGVYADKKLTINTAELDVEKGTRFVLSGGWNFETKEILSAKIKGMITEEAAHRWLPEKLGFSNAEITAEASGLLGNFSHQGRVQATQFKWTGMKPVRLSVDWHGTGKSVNDFILKAGAGESDFLVRGALTEDSAELKELTLLKKQAVQMKLETPVRVNWRPQVSVENFHLSGPAGGVAASVIWAPEGKMEISVHGFTPEWIDDWMESGNRDWQVSSLQMQGSWKKGPMVFTLQGEGRFSLGQDRSALVVVNAGGNKDGAKIESIRVSEASGNIISASGRLPVRFYPAQGPFFQWSDAEQFNLQAATEPNAEFWQRLTELTGLELVNPRVNLNLSGTRSTMQGTANVQMDRVAMDEKKIKRAWPAIEGLDVALSGDTSRVKVDKFSLTIEKQAVRAQGDLALVRGFWPDLQADPLAYVQKHGTFHLDVPDAEISAFTRFLPNILSPVGRIMVDLNLKEGGHLDGAIKLSEAASRPLGPLGILQDISADVRFEDRTVKLQSVVARAGGQPVMLTGTVELRAGVEPHYDVALKGENIPFVRQMGLLLRGDLDLKLTSPASGPPQVTGKAQLHDSLFLADVRAFIPSGSGQGGAGRPPYFAVETPPLNAWLLNVEIAGRRFMRLQTPVFTGTMSAQFNLGGTLGAPRMTGDATIDQGRVLMPFVSFTVDQGSVRLTEVNPYEPALFVRGTARRFGYDLGFELSGTASRPVVVFTSSPALASEQVLLMVMTGSAPANEMTSTMTQRATRIGAFLGQGLLDSVRGSSGGEEHLSIVSGEKISRQGRETYNIEYGLSERWALTGEYDEFDDYNLGVKWLILRDRPWEKEKAGDEKK